MTAANSDHLNLDAIVAFADGEMTLVAYQRAAAHVARCPQCDNEVNQQVVARSWLRAAGSPAMPNSLLDTLKSIPVAVPAARPVDGVTIDPVTGRVVRSDDAARSAHRGWRFRFLGAGALVAGLAVGALVVGADQQDAETGSPGGPQGANLSAVSSPFVVPVKLGTTP
jgi:anti-sigma factor RsiW